MKLLSEPEWDRLLALPAEVQLLPPLQRALLKRVDDLPLPASVRNAFTEADVLYVGELAMLEGAFASDGIVAPDGYFFANMGARTAQSVDRILMQDGLHIGMRIPDWSRPLAGVIRALTPAKP
jgi:hypothetical protein